MTGTSSSSNTSTSGSEPELGGSIWKVKYEQELKRRQELEQRILILEGKASPETAAEIAAKKKEDRKTKRMTKKIQQTQRMSIHVVNTVESVLQQIGGLDKKIRGAEAARLQAEDKLLEIAIAKLEVDEVVQKVDTVLKKMVEQIDKFSIPQIKEMLVKVRTQTAAQEEGGSSKAANSRFSIIIPSGGLQLDDSAPPPPMPMAMDSAPSPPGKPMINKQPQAAPSAIKPSSLLEVPVFINIIY